MPLLCYPVSALEKVFLDEPPKPCPRHIPLTALKGELVSLGVALCLNPPSEDERELLWVSVSCALPNRLRRVEQMPVRYPCRLPADDNYLRKEPGLYPDALTTLDMDKPLPVYLHQWSSLWVDIETGPDTQAGAYCFKISFKNESGDLVGEAEQTFQIIDALLPPQSLIHARWLHADALADAYDVPMFCDRHFEILERFIRLAVQRGINMILVPIHTPPLDTRQGGQRRTAQLVDVALVRGEYRFGFEKLRRFLAICAKAGVAYYEMAHLFSQWGAYHPPKIMGNADGREVQLFGWETDALGHDYQAFLAAYLPALTDELRRQGIAKQCYFHISDEPGIGHIAQYRAVKNAVSAYLEGFTIMDALSDYDFYEDGTVAHPIVSTDHLGPFLKADIPDLWVYYCSAQGREVSNTFIAMPSSRTRILGLQLYIYKVKGFLQWAYNYYYAQYSDYYVDPWHITDADGFAPAGDAFQVYPGRGGEPAESLRLMVFFHALQDLRALQALEAAIGRDQVLDMIGEGLDDLPTMSDYPRDPDYLLELRRRVNAALEVHAPVDIARAQT